MKHTATFNYIKRTVTIHSTKHMATLFLLWRAPQQMLRTHHSLKAYCATLWWRWLVCFVFPSNGARVEWNWQGYPKYSGGKTCPSATLSTTNATWTDPRSKPGLRGERPATNRPSHGTATLCYYSKHASTMCHETYHNTVLCNYETYRHAVWYYVTTTIMTSYCTSLYSRYCEYVNHILIVRYLYKSYSHCLVRMWTISSLLGTYVNLILIVRYVCEPYPHC
jgi:hypothetical protein